MTKDKIINKIVNLMKLSNDANDEEGQASIALAQKLMIKHDISMQEIEQKSNKTEIKTSELRFGRVLWWQKDLAATIARAFKCRALASNKTIEFVGLNEHSQIAKDVYEGAIAHIKYRRSMMKNATKAEKNSYIDGFIQGLDERLMKQETELAKEECTDLIVCVPAEVNHWIALRGYRSTTVPDMPSSFDAKSYHIGKDEGENAEILRSNLIK